MGALIAFQAASDPPAMNDEELQAQPREVQPVPGARLLRLQSYQGPMAALIAHPDIAGPAHPWEKIRAARIDDAFTTMLGTPVRPLLGS